MDSTDLEVVDEPAISTSTLTLCLDLLRMQQLKVDGSDFDVVAVRVIQAKKELGDEIERRKPRAARRAKARRKRA